MVRPGPRGALSEPRRIVPRHRPSTPSPLHDPDQRRRGRRHLAKVDPELARTISHLGDRRPGRRIPHFERLCGTIIGQQLSVVAARTITDRLRRRAGRLDPAALAGLDDADLRACGLSAAKAAALRDLCAHVDDGRLRPDQLWRSDDETVTERLVRVRGIGPWSADMFLLFGLGRRDVWATGDLGLRRALQLMDGLEDMPSVPAMIARAEAWRPWRGLASLYLWARLEPDGELTRNDTGDKRTPS